MYVSRLHALRHVKRRIQMKIKHTISPFTTNTTSSNASHPLPPFVARRLALFKEEKSRQKEMNGEAVVQGQDLIPIKQMKKNLNSEDSNVSTEAQRTYWHSAAHVLGQAIELHLPDALLCDGPPLVGEGAAEKGFYYQVALPDDVVIDDNKRNELEQTMKLISREKQSFERLEVTRQFAKELFCENEYKLALLDRIPEKDAITVYRNGPFVDLCRGPHVQDTSLFGAIKLLKTSASHFRIQNKEVEEEDELKSVQRVYGIAFRKPKELKQYDALMKLASERDHRLIGTKQSLFMFDSTSPGSPFFLPHGTRIINRLKHLLRTMYWTDGYDEVRTPMIFHKKLWEISGHLENYSDDMYGVVEGFDGGCNDHDHDHGDSVTEFGLKPMNCPAHCLMFKSSNRSYRDLPLRFSDFGALHRNENSGSLRGLTRVRCFHQDDAHIFCTPKQISSEILSCLHFVDRVYIDRFGFDHVDMKLSTRPIKKAGTNEQWDQAELALETMLKEYGRPWTIEEGDGAFYGPKIDIRVKDVMGRYHQVATIQLDFQLPNRFELEYSNEDGMKATPVMVHRAVLGSVERMVAVLCEHWGGRWPLWLSPRQVAVCPVSSDVSHITIVVVVLDNVVLL
jgi:threonyl-tRNA synthetase